MATPVARAADLLRVLGDATRLELLARLQGRELCVCELVARFPISQPAVSAHLRRLRDAGLVHDERRGMWVYYRAAEQLPDVVRAALSEVVLPETVPPRPSTVTTAAGCCSPGEPAAGAPPDDRRAVVPHPSRSPRTRRAGLGPQARRRRR